jgi:hypothetical protein
MLIFFFSILRFTPTFLLCMYLFPVDWEYILPLFIYGAGFSQHGVSLWAGYAPKASGTILSSNLVYRHVQKLHQTVILIDVAHICSV